MSGSWAVRFGRNELDADQLFGSIEQQLFSKALSMAENEAVHPPRGRRRKRFVGRHPACRDLTAIQHNRCGSFDKESMRTARQIVKPGKTWRPKRQFNLEIHLPMGTSFTKSSAARAKSDRQRGNLLHRRGCVSVTPWRRRKYTITTWCTSRWRSKKGWMKDTKTPWSTACARISKQPEEESSED